MAHVQTFNFNLQVSPQIPPGTTMKLVPSPGQLARAGYNMLVAISAPAAQSGNSASARSAIVMAHLDTGASVTNISDTLAQYLGLTSVGLSPSFTANGPTKTPDYVVDISFPNSGLRPFSGLRISSCSLPFKIDANGAIAPSINNFGVLIGRDIMSSWNITWHGPSSTVFISD